MGTVIIAIIIVLIAWNAVRSFRALFGRKWEVCIMTTLEVLKILQADTGLRKTSASAVWGAEASALPTVLPTQFPG